jgi:hypothetical protein
MAQQSGSDPATPQPVSGILPPESIPPDLLGEFRSSLPLAEWTLAIEGEWYEDAYHGGSVSYLIRRHESGAWVFKSSERNTCLDDVTEEDVEDGRLSDDQLQALWGTTLEKAQNRVCERVVAAWIKPPDDAVMLAAARALYEFVVASCGKRIDDRGDQGLLVEPKRRTGRR